MNINLDYPQCCSIVQDINIAKSLFFWKPSMQCFKKPYLITFALISIPIDACRCTLEQKLRMSIYLKPISSNPISIHCEFHITKIFPGFHNLTIVAFEQNISYINNRLTLIITRLISTITFLVELFTNSKCKKSISEF